MKWILIYKTQTKSYSIDDNSNERGEKNTALMIMHDCMTSLLVTIHYRCI